MTIFIIVAIILILINLWLTYKINKRQFDFDLKEIKKTFDGFYNELSKFDTTLKDELSRSRDELNKNFRETRGELNDSIKNLNDSILKRINEIAHLQKNQLDTFSNQLNSLFKRNIEKLDKLTESIESRLDKMREELESKLKSIQKDNNEKLEKMRETVDEKLHATLEKRLSDSFNLVSQRLELVQKGLGEMQSLAIGVGDLKKVLTNVKTRGVIGEYQLINILEQIMTREQYQKNVKTKGGSEAMVEFAIKLPGRDDKDKAVWLPIDSKFPTEDYQRLMDAYEKGDINDIENNTKQLVNRIKISAKDIKEKYIDPPNTTDFAIMFLPFEGLYAEVLRSPGLFEILQKDYKVIMTGPTTLSALLNSLQMGFRTLAIEKRSSDVWELLGAVKTEFGRFGEVLTKTQKKLSEASSEIEKAGVRSRAIERKLRDVQEIPKPETLKLIESGLIDEDKSQVGEEVSNDENSTEDTDSDNSESDSQNQESQMPF